MMKHADTEEGDGTRSHVTPRRNGRPVTRAINLDAAPEKVAQAVFAAAKPPNPNNRSRHVFAE